MPKPIDTIIEYTDPHFKENRAFIQRSSKGNWYCELANGVLASFSYAGIKPEHETDFKIALLRATDVADVRATLLRFSYNYYAYKFI